MSHFYKGETVYDKPKVYPFVRIEPHHFTKIQGQRIFDYKDNVADKSQIKTMLFTNFKKACHDTYQFDSNEFSESRKKLLKQIATELKNRRQKSR